MMNIALIGYGKMGKTIERLAKERNYNIVETIDINEEEKINKSLAKIAEVAIEFTTPSSCEKNIIKCLENGISVVCGTTGWDYNKKKISDLCDKNKVAFFYSSNFSIGVNIFFEINRNLARILDKYEMYKVSIEETHHIHKLDKPSGTALSLAKDIVSNSDRYSCFSGDNSDIIKAMAINSIREGEVVGNHKVVWESVIDSIKIEHDAKSRDGFALGAILAAEYIKGKQGIYSMQDLLKF